MSGIGDPFFLFCAASVAMALAVGLAWFAWSSSREALASCFMLVLLAGTKLRQRAASASLSGELDYQIALELSIYGGLAVMIGSLLLSRRLARRPPAPAEIVLLAYVGLTVASTAWSFAPAFTAVRGGQLLILFGLAYVSVRVLGTDRTVRMGSGALVLYVIGCAAAVAVGLPGARDYTRTDFLGFTRFTWFALHPITAATLTALAALVTLVTAATATRGWRERRFGLPLWAYFGVLVTLLLLTYSRGPLAAFLAAAALITVSSLSRRAIAVLAPAALLVIVAAALWTNSAASFDTDSALAHTISRGQDREQLVGLSGRVELWKAALPLVFERPALGYGYHGSRPILLEYASWAGYTHNAFLQTLLDLGIAGVLLVWPALFWLVFVSARRLFGPLARPTPPLTFVLATAVFLIVSSVTSESFTGTTGYEALLLFTCVSIAAHAPRREAVQTFRDGLVGPIVPKAQMRRPSRIPAGRSLTSESPHRA